MCGILGAIANHPLKEYEKNLERLFTESESRGKDSMGFYALNLSEKPICVIEKEDKTKIEFHNQLFKEPTHPSKFFTSQKGSLDLSSVEVLLAHTRQGTGGDPKLNKNNHPFETKSLVWAHNGVIHKEDELKKKFDLQYESQCDSFVIGAMIQKFLDEGGDIVDAIKKAGEELHGKGNYSVWLIHKGTKRIFFFRNQNPMDYAKLKDGTFVFASGIWFIKNAFDVKNIVSTSSTTPDRLYELVQSESGDFSVEVVADLPKVQQSSNIYSNTGKTGKSSASRGSSQGTEKTKCSVEAPKVLSERAVEIGDKYDLKGHFCRKSDTRWVFATSDQKFITAMEATSFSKLMKELERTTEGRVMMLSIYEAEMSRFFDEIETHFEPKFRPEPGIDTENYLRFFEGLNGITYQRDTGQRVYFHVSDTKTADILGGIGVSLSPETGEFSVKKGRNNKSAVGTLGTIQQKLKLAMKAVN